MGGKTIASVYSVRPKPGAPVSTPLRWDELKPAVRPRDFTMTVALERLQGRGDLFAPVLDAPARAGGEGTRASDVTSPNARAARLPGRLGLLSALGGVLGGVLRDLKPFGLLVSVASSLRSAPIRTMTRKPIPARSRAMPTMTLNSATRSAKKRC